MLRDHPQRNQVETSIGVEILEPALAVLVQPPVRTDRVVRIDARKRTAARRKHVGEPWIGGEYSMPTSDIQPVGLLVNQRKQGCFVPFIRRVIAELRPQLRRPSELTGIRRL